MIYITGDIHGNQILWENHIKKVLKTGDTLIILGDFGIGFLDGIYWPEELFFDYLSEQDYTVLFIDGNHENFNKLNAYDVSEWNGGNVHFIRHNIIHLMRGEIFTIENKKVFVFGGGYSLDKEFRSYGKSWWPEEMPSEEEYENGTNNLKKYGYIVDYIFTHTAPLNTIKYMSYLRLGIKKAVMEEFMLTRYLQWIEKNTAYSEWYFGHFHIDRRLWKHQYAVLNEIHQFNSEKVIGNRMELK